MNWGKRNECELSVGSKCRWRLIVRHGSAYCAFLWLRFRLVWNSYNEGETIFEY